MIGCGISAFSPRPCLATKRPRLVVPMIVPPMGMMPCGIFQRQDLVVDRREQALVAVDEAEHFPAQGMGRRDRGADDRVEAGTIPAAG